MNESTYWNDRYDAQHASDGDRLRELSGHYDGIVRRWVARNRNTPLDALKRLAEDGEDEVSSTAAIRLSNWGIDSVYDTCYTGVNEREDAQMKLKLVPMKYGTGFQLVTEDGTVVGHLQVVLTPFGGTVGNTHIIVSAAPQIEAGIENISIKI